MIGEIKTFPKPVTSSDLLLCDGSNFDAATYPDLAAFLGGNVLPDLIGRYQKHSATGGQTGDGLLVPDMLPTTADDGNTDEPSGNHRAKAGGGETIYHSGTPDQPQTPLEVAYLSTVPYIVAQ